MCTATERLDDCFAITTATQNGNSGGEFKVAQFANRFESVQLRQVHFDQGNRWPFFDDEADYFFPIVALCDDLVRTRVD